MQVVGPSKKVLSLDSGIASRASLRHRLFPCRIGTLVQQVPVPYLWSVHNPTQHLRYPLDGGYGRHGRGRDEG